jgi:AAHS family 4-hydroxybenzoate transporter-like MFS transporter
VLAVVLLTVPESIRFMVVQRRAAQEITKVLQRIDRGFMAPERGYTVPARDKDAGKAPLAVLFSARFRTGSYLLWLTYFMGLVVYYLLTSWMPTLMRESGFTLQRAALMTALLSLGAGVGPVILGWLMDRINPYNVVGTGFLLAGVFVLAMGGNIRSADALPYPIFTTGVFLAGALTSMPVLASSFYPTSARASGVAWMLGIGRFGGVVGALAGGPLLSAGYSIGHILGLLAIPSCIAAAALFVQGRRDHPAAVVELAVAR